MGNNAMKGLQVKPVISVLSAGKGTWFLWRSFRLSLKIADGQVEWILPDYDEFTPKGFFDRILVS
jgi:hypothetical protein